MWHSVKIVLQSFSNNYHVLMKDNAYDSVKKFDSDSVYVNMYARVCPVTAIGKSEEEKLQELNVSMTHPAEITLREFLRLGTRYIDTLESIWNISEKKVRNNRKRQCLPAATISATLHTRDINVPLSEKIKKYNGIIALDFDDVTDVEAAKKKVAGLPYVWYVGYSASKRGFFAIVPTDNTRYEDHILYFYALRQEMAKLGFRIDEACKDVTRLRFVSFDPEPIYNEKCELFRLPEGFDREQYVKVKEQTVAIGENAQLARVKAYADEWERRKIALDYYVDWLKMCMALSTLGQFGWETLDRISVFSSHYDAEENRKTFDKFAGRSSQVGLGSFFFVCHQYGIFPKNLPQYEPVPYPVHVFPEEIQDIIMMTNACLNFNSDHIASCLLFVASVAVGNSVMVELKNEWTDKPILYMAIVGKPGTNKSAPLKYALRPLFERDEQSLEKYEEEYARYEEQMKTAVKNRSLFPDEPAYRQIVMSDFTTEVLIRQHKVNPRSLAVYVDELIGFIKNFNKYRNGNDEQVWTQLYNGGSVIVNRMSSQPLNIRDTCIGVIGTIQPGLLHEFAKGKTESGFVDRWLFSYPDDTTYPKLTDDQLPEEITGAWRRIINRILDIPYDREPKVIRLSPEAMKIYTNWFNSLADLKNSSSVSFAEAATKMERYCIRFAIVLEALNYGCGEGELEEISDMSVKRAIDLCYYYMSCTMKARKKFQRNPLEDLNERQRQIYRELPINFSTAEGLEIALGFGSSERAFKDWLKTDFFKHVSHGQYEKRYG